MKLVILDGNAANPGDLSWDGLREFGELIVYDRTPQQLAVERIGDADIVITNKVVVTAELLDACPNVRLVCVLATGYNTVDTEAARQRNVTVCNVPAYSTDSVAQLTMALLLEICLRVGDHNNSVHAGDWVRAKDYSYWNYPLIEIADKTMGIIGMGSIGQRVACLARAFGMKIVYYSRTEKPELEKEGYRYMPMDELLAESDVVSLHCPLTEETTGLINAAALDKMKQGAILLNTTRGAVIVEKDVASALQSGKLYAAGVDVLSSEPPSADNPLLALDNCIITPHIAWAPTEARTRLIGVVVDNVKNYLAGTPVNVVN